MYDFKNSLSPDFVTFIEQNIFFLETYFAYTISEQKFMVYKTRDWVSYLLANYTVGYQISVQQIFMFFEQSHKVQIEIQAIFCTI